VIGAGTNVWLILKREDDAVHHPVQVLADVRRREPEHAKAFALQDFVPHEIMLGLKVVSVLEAVDLNREPATEAGEVQIVPANGILPANVETAFTQMAQARPQDDLGFAHISAELAGAADFMAHAIAFYICSQGASRESLVSKRGV